MSHAHRPVSPLPSAREGQSCTAGMCWCPAHGRVLVIIQNSSTTNLGCALPVLQGTWDPAGLRILGELGGMCAVHSGAGMEVSPLNSQLPISTKPFKEFSSTWKSNKHLDVQNQAFPRALFLHRSRCWVEPTLRDSHSPETSSLFNIFIARTETSTQGSAQHRHGTSWGRLPGWPATPWHMQIASAP